MLLLPHFTLAAVLVLEGVVMAITVAKVTMLIQISYFRTVTLSMLACTTVLFKQHGS